jgi:TolB-like protein/Flp pilus assembly protein TadD
MKRCPECRRDYYDDTLLYCLDDGNALLEGPASGGRTEPPASAGGQFGEPQTAILRSTDAPGEAPTRAHIHTTEQTAILSTGAEADPRESLGGPSEQGNLSANRAAKPLAVLVAAAVLVGVFFGYRYFNSTGRGQISSIAVLPLQNNSGNADSEYLSDGLAESLIYRLSQLPDLKVSSASSVMRYKGQAVDPKKIAAELGVQAILFGRLMQRGESFSISVELIDAETNTTLWGEQYERKMSELLATQREITAEITNKLQLKLSGESGKKLEKNYTNSNEAYQLYLKGRFYLNKRTTESLRQAAEFFRQAVEKDPNYSLAYSGLAETYAIFPIWSVAPPKDTMPQAKAAAQRALELDETVAQAHLALALYLNYFEFDRSGAERAARRAIELEPNYATPHEFLAVDLLSPMMRFDEAVSEINRAEELDPLSSPIGTNAGWVLIDARRFDDAIARLKRVLSVNPNYPYAMYVTGFALDGKGLYEEAAVEYRKSLALNDDPFVKGLLARALAKSGKRSEALAMIAELRSESKKRYVPNYPLAIAAIAIGDKNEALDLLEKDIDERSPFVSYIASQFVVDDLRGDPRFREMLRRLNLPE